MGPGPWDPQNGPFWPIFDPILGPLFERSWPGPGQDLRIRPPGMAHSGQDLPKGAQKGVPKWAQNRPFWALQGLGPQIWGPGDPLGGPLGPPKWPIFGSKMGPKMGPFWDPFLTPFWPKKGQNPAQMAQGLDPKMAHFWAKNGSKMGPKRVKKGSKMTPFLI